MFGRFPFKSEKKHLYWVRAVWQFSDADRAEIGAFKNTGGAFGNATV